MSTGTGADDAVVRTWFDEEGWGVLDSPSTPGGCWTHFSVIDAEGYRALTPGAKVQLRWEHPGQDGYDYRATWVQAQAYKLSLRGPVLEAEVLVGPLSVVGRRSSGDCAAGRGAGRRLRA